MNGVYPDFPAKTRILWKKNMKVERSTFCCQAIGRDTEFHLILPQPSSLIWMILMQGVHEHKPAIPSNFDRVWKKNASFWNRHVLPHAFGKSRRVRKSGSITEFLLVFFVFYYTCNQKVDSKSSQCQELDGSKVGQGAMEIWKGFDGNEHTPIPQKRRNHKDASDWTSFLCSIFVFLEECIWRMCSMVF